MADNISMSDGNRQTLNLPPVLDVEERINQMYGTITQLQSQVQAKAIKVKPPESFNSNWSKLQGFLTQLELYMQMNREQLTWEEDKVLFATSYLTRPMFDWFEPIICNYQDYQYKRQNQDTRDIFSNFGQFKKYL